MTTTTKSPAARRAARNKRNGADWEIDLEEGFTAEGYDIARLHLNGQNDIGDLVIREEGGVHLVIEAKSGEFKPGTFIGEAERERVNYATKKGLPNDKVDSIVIVKRRGHTWRQAYVLTTVEDYFGLDIQS